MKMRIEFSNSLITTDYNIFFGKIYFTSDDGNRFVY